MKISRFAFDLPCHREFQHYCSEGESFQIGTTVLPGAIWRRKGVHPTWPWSGGDVTTGGGGGGGGSGSGADCGGGGGGGGGSG